MLSVLRSPACRAPHSTIGIAKEPRENAYPEFFWIILQVTGTLMSPDRMALRLLQGAFFSGQEQTAPKQKSTHLKRLALL